MPIQAFLEDGVIQLKKGNLVKIIKIKPIHFELKSEFEKRSILNAYAAFLKNCNFDMQILIQSKQENLSPIIEKLKRQKEKEISSYPNHTFMSPLFDQYIAFIQRKNQEKLSSSKNFYIIIISNKFPENQKENAYLELKEKYFKLKDSLIRCGNQVEEIKSKEELTNIFNVFFNQKGGEMYEN